MSNTITIRDDADQAQTIKVGDFVGFKYDVEQSGQITAIAGERVTVTATEGGYVHGDSCHEDCQDCSSSVVLLVEDLWI